MEAEKNLTPRGAALIDECTGVGRRWHNHYLPGVEEIARRSPIKCCSSVTRGKDQVVVAAAKAAVLRYS